MSAVTRPDIIKRISLETNWSQQAIKKVIKLYEKAIVDELVKGNEVRLFEFLIFRVKDHIGKVYYNPETGEKRKLEAKKRAKVVISPIIQDRINEALKDS